jgi:hypothetical protein
MKISNRETLAWLGVCTTLTLSGAAFAQAPGMPQTAPPPPQPSPPAQVQTGITLPPPPPPAPPPAPEPAPGATDHSAVAGHFGVGYLGRRTIQIATNTTGGQQTANAPVIGVRYWLDERLGIDAGLGLLIQRTSATQEAGGISASADQPGFTVFILHGGVPLSLATGRHYSFQIVPELNFGYGSSSVGANPETSLNGIHLDLGARAGAEVQFGFIGIPELALQASVGVALSYDRTTGTTPGQNGAGDTSGSVSQTTFGSSVGGSPWDIFTSSIAALYYF